MEITEKIFSALERIHTATRSALQTTVHQHGMSPLQAQILLYLCQKNVSNTSHLADYFKVTKPTISDAVKTLISKKLLNKTPLPNDARAFHLTLTTSGRKEAKIIASYATPFLQSVDEQTTEEKNALWGALLHLVHTMESQGLIPHNRMCFSCQHFIKNTSNHTYYCGLMGKPLAVTNLRIDCNEHKPQIAI